MKYRIKQLRDGRFIIEAKHRRIEGILWWKKEVNKWVPCDKIGNPLFNAATDFTEKYLSVKMAKKQYKVWKSADKIIDLK